MSAIASALRRIGALTIDGIWRLASPPASCSRCC